MRHNRPSDHSLTNYPHSFWFHVQICNRYQYVLLDQSINSWHIEKYSCHYTIELEDKEGKCMQNPVVN